jgi:hypothetical protein
MRLMIFLLAMLALPAMADTWPDLEGTWAGTTRFVSYQSSDGQTDTTNNPFFAEQNVEIVLGDNHEGRYFGTLELQGLPEQNPIVLIVSGDGVTLFASDIYGTSDGHIIDDDRIELCRAEFSQEPLSLYAVCLELSREDP